MSETNTPIKPVGERVVVKPLEQEAITASGIIIPDSTSQEKPQQGKVIALGDITNEKGNTILSSLKVGDTVLFKKYANDEVEISGQMYLVMEADSVLAIII